MIFSRRNRKPAPVAQIVRPEPTIEQALELLAQDRAGFALTADIRTSLRAEQLAPTKR